MMNFLLAVGVTLAALTVCVQGDSYALQGEHQPRLFSGWGWGKKKPILTISKGWGWKKPTIKAVGIYGGIRLHHGESKGGWGKSHGWGGQSHGHGGWGWRPKVHHQKGWGWDHESEHHGGWGHEDHEDEGWGWERSLPILVAAPESAEESSAEASGEVRSFQPTIEFQDEEYFEPAFYQ